MVKCSFCDKPAVYINKVNGKAYCKKHFLEYFDHKVRKTIRKYRMFDKKEHIVVAVSGGKDSLSLLYFLNKLSKKVPGWKISALLIDEGIKGYREYTIKDFLRIVEKLDVPYRIASFKEYFGYTLDEIVAISREKKLPYLPCSYCGVFRRYLLNKVAREMGGTVLATAHNLDDIIQTYMMNIIKNSWDKVARLAPITGVIEHPKFIKRVKPFYEVLEKETTLYALLNNLLEPVFYECPYVEYNIRVYIRRYLNELEEEYPGTKYSILKSLLRIIEILKNNPKEITKGTLQTCRVCGEVSSHPICRSCMYRYELGIMKLEEEEIVKKVLKELKIS
ncbi:MAG: TIGR00269 family protein [Desulfurococcales archaeon ex4484_58]|nr:MAG: TIGR00269 family protein [Desulfurococcales archaeon ex4484_58]